MSSNIRILARWKQCDGVELLVNVDSRNGADLDWLNTTADTILFSRNIHEIRAYNKLARVASGDVLAFVQDDAAPPVGCAYLDTVARLDDFPRVERVQYVACVDIGPLLIQKKDFFSLGEFDANFSAAGQGGIGLDFDLSTRAWLNDRTVLFYTPARLPGKPAPLGQLVTISRSMVQKVMGKRVYASKPKIRVRLRRPHNRNKKWRIEVIDTGKSVEFGQAGASDFTIHGEPARMVRYLVRHAGNVPDSLKQTGGTEKNIVHWGVDNLSRAVESAGFWSRWLLWHCRISVGMVGLV
ncbi:hypothetical protein EMIHUDRAFT_230976 [Emiliania huxleyi CCMP1516]|uniref:Uncharacterized protein n=2 Tax=Emiliania huxleyi TaxID=2903 RepID=A0A0D3K9H6_EMIH1|nr:hypothetical protein EMIHUDRAFT_230976 [Emiliania huxleyi CCMP1516]EOD32411.1 hypothetical protein EMIHUDRAFT_230976 [Emiliania huxleyi CCMP1516]|eukprot:XP_005784840.1 hypothetical protein EMIHUDRAFT_230976 [Emiliania huxleyi CCMP1516]